MKISRDTPCKECPFRRASTPGWLGPWTPEQIIWHLESNPFPCHKTIKGGEEDTARHLHGCAGAAQFLSNRCKLSRDRATADHQDAIGSARGPGTHPEVFDTTDEFIKYHRSLGLCSGDLV